MQRDILTVFLASPGDLKEERAMARKTVDRFNKVFGRRLNWHIDLMGWEDTLPQYERPQEAINKAVDQCDIFIGLLYKRWGSTTGKEGFSSGFEEEFERVRDRRRLTGKPDIWLHFKKVLDTEDPGDQLRKVIRFKEEQILLKECLFVEFDTTFDFGNLINDALSAYILDNALVKEETIKKAQLPSIPSSQEGITEVDSTTLTTTVTYPDELIKLFKKLDTIVIEKGPEELTFIDRSRLFLLTSSWFSESYNNELYGTHEINIAYKMRKNWKLTPTENKIILRTIISDTGTVCPGWQWFADLSENDIDRLLCDFSTLDTKSEVRKGAIALLNETNYSAPLNFIKTILDDNDDKIKLEAIKLFRSRGKVQDLDLLDPLINSDNYEVGKEAFCTKVEILFLNNQNDGFAEYIKYDGIMPVPTALSQAKDSLQLNVDEKLLFKALDSTSPTVRRFTAQYLRDSKKLTKEICEKLISDTDEYVVSEGFLGLVGLGERVHIPRVNDKFSSLDSQAGNVLAGFHFFQKNKVIYEILRNRSPKDLRKLLHWFDPNGYVAYRILALEHFETIENRIRSDLDNNFESLRLDSKKLIISQYGDNAESFIKGLDEVNEYIRANYISAALAGLGKNGNLKDIKYGRKFLGNTENNLADLESVRIMSRFGETSDTKVLYNVALNSHGEVQSEAAKAALKLSQEEILIKMLESKNSRIAIIAANSIMSMKLENKYDVAKWLLFNNNDKVRIKAVLILSKICKPNELENILNTYLDESIYYYNVVTWIDRCLYTPGRYKDYFKQLLDKIPEEDYISYSSFSTV